MDDRADMLALLRRLASECDASTDARSWKARIGLTSGALVELGRIDLDELPVVVLEDRRQRTVVYTTLRDIVHIELAKGGAPRLERALASSREEAKAPW
jgi:hypothetical protein